MEQSKQPLVSIVVPLYNQERYLGACLRSITGQTYRSIEVVVVNDGSTDDSLNIAKNWAGRDSRIKIIDKPNEGVTLARRDGYLNATGEYLAFVDSDDLLPPRAMEILVKHALEQDVDVVLGSAIRKLGPIKWSKFTGTFPLNRVVTQPELFDDYYVSFFGKSIFHINMWGRLYRKAIVDKAYAQTELFPVDIRFMGEDLYFNMKLFPYLNSMYRTDEMVYYYRYGGTVEHFNPDYTLLFKLSDKRMALLDEFGYEQGYGPLYGEYVNTLYHYAKKLISFKHASEDEVIAFFCQEEKERALMPRLREYYANHEPKGRVVCLLLDRNYEDLYRLAYQELQQYHNSVKYKTKRLLMRVVDAFA